jgi:hypothetical protein
MSTKRRVIDRGKGGRLTPEIIDAWKRADFEKLHILLRLGPWEASPLPLEITLLGCSQDDEPPEYPPDRKSLQRSQALQRQLLAVAGWPDCRQVYERNLARAKKTAAHCRQQYEHPPAGEYGTGCDPESRRQRMEEAEDEVAYRRELLAGFEAMRAEWAPVS